ncbi:hypothetical protein GCM10022221_18170 [Actinocorallia aurea]
MAPMGERGQAFWDHATGTFDLDRHELELLTQVCRMMDRADALQAEILETGPMVVTSRGDRRPNPAIGEERQISLAVGRLLSQLDIPAEDDSTSLASPAKVRARRAAERRWANRPTGNQVSEAARAAASARWSRA